MLVPGSSARDQRSVLPAPRSALPAPALRARPLSAPAPSLRPPPLWLRGARVLCHDAFYVGGPEPNHTRAEDAARVAAEAGVERLVLMHLNPKADEEAELRASRPIFAATEVGRDGMAV